MHIRRVDSQERMLWSPVRSVAETLPCRTLADCVRSAVSADIPCWWALALLPPSLSAAPTMMTGQWLLLLLSSVTVVVIPMFRLDEVEGEQLEEGDDDVDVELVGRQILTE